MAKFVYNNAKHASIRYTLFKLNCGYNLRISYKEDINPRSRSKAADKLTKKLENLMVTCRENLQYIQKMQKRAHNKEIKPRNYFPSEKI